MKLNPVIAFAVVKNEYPPIARFDPGVVYYCGDCNYPHIGGAPKWCPRCDAKHTKFKRKG